MSIPGQSFIDILLIYSIYKNHKQQGSRNSRTGSHSRSCSSPCISHRFLCTAEFIQHHTGHQDGKNSNKTLLYNLRQGGWQHVSVRLEIASECAKNSGKKNSRRQHFQGKSCTCHRLRHQNGGAKEAEQCHNPTHCHNIKKCTVENLLCIFIALKRKLLCHNLGHRLWNTKGGDHQQNKIYILSIIEKSHTAVSKGIGKRTFIEHSDDLGNQCRDHQK